PPLFYIQPATTLLYPLSLHDALPIWRQLVHAVEPQLLQEQDGGAVQERPAVGFAAALLDQATRCQRAHHAVTVHAADGRDPGTRSEEHTSELQSRRDIVCRLLLEKK